jgi:hypothetical protein
MAAKTRMQKQFLRNHWKRHFFLKALPGINLPNSASIRFWPLPLAHRCADAS